MSLRVFVTSTTFVQCHVRIIIYALLAHHDYDISHQKVMQWQLLKLIVEKRGKRQLVLVKMKFGKLRSSPKSLMSMEAVEHPGEGMY